MPKYGILCFFLRLVHSTYTYFCTRICTRTYASHDCLLWNARRRRILLSFARTDDDRARARASERARMKERKTEITTQKREGEREAIENNRSFTILNSKEWCKGEDKKKNRVIADGLFVCCLEDVRDFFRCFGRKREGKDRRKGLVGFFVTSCADPKLSVCSNNSKGPALYFRKEHGTIVSRRRSKEGGDY